MSFLYENRDNDQVAVSVLRDADDKYGDRIGILSLGYPRDMEVWYWRTTYPEDLLEYVGHIPFPNKDIAANFLNSLNLRAEKYRKEHPLPDDVNRYLVERARGLQKEEQRILSEFTRIRHEQWRLLQFAKRNQIEEVVWTAGDSDNEKVVRDLLEFKVHVKGKEVPLVSEAALYELIGKSEARTALALIERLCNCVAPNVSS